VLYVNDTDSRFAFGGCSGWSERRPSKALCSLSDSSATFKAVPQDLDEFVEFYNTGGRHIPRRDAETQRNRREERGGMLTLWTSDFTDTVH
jgi:hypothetical protein